MDLQSKIFIFFLIAFASSKSIKNPRSITDININKETDFVLRHADKYIKNHDFDPYPIPTQKFNFSHGYIELMTGSLEGISTLVRSDDAYLHETSTTVTLPLKFKNLSITSDYNIHIIIKDNVGSWSAKVQDLDFNLDVSYNQAAKNITFNSIVIDKIGNFTPLISGAFSHEIVKEIHEILKDHTYNQIVGAINDIIAHKAVPWINQHLPNHF